LSHGYEFEGKEASPAPPVAGILGLLLKLQARLNSAVMVLSMIAILAACFILTGSVFLRYYFKIPTDWQDEMSVFLLVGAMFMCGAYVQSQRGHIGIEALAGFFSPAANRLRLLFCDIASFAFCAFFTWKTWSMLHEAVVEGQTTSSSWAPPLWIPYGLMAVGMTLLSLQILLQIITSLNTKGTSK
jgi:TRAP-type C4-dicarboxylate transport system permease small subunit